MNWYKIAQKIPPTASTLLNAGNKALVDTNNIIYPIQGRMVHVDWIEKYAEFLKENYNFEANKNTVDALEKLILDGWMRFLLVGNGAMFAIRSFSDRDRIKMIEEFLFSSQQIENVFIRSMEEWYIEFVWQDFIQSGESFTDYVRGKI